MTMHTVNRMLYKLNSQCIWHPTPILLSSSHGALPLYLCPLARPFSADMHEYFRTPLHGTHSKIVSLPHSQAHLGNEEDLGAILFSDAM